MKQQRLPWLLALLCALVVLRWLAPPLNPEPVAVSQAVVRPATPARPAEAATPAANFAAQPVADLPTPDVPQNAFAVRGPAMPIAAAPPRAPVALAPAASPAPAAPPPPPLQVIGTWDDGARPGVFVSTSQGTLLARKGDLLLAQYRVTEVTSQQLSLQHVATSSDHRLAVPQAAGR